MRSLTWRRVALTRPEAGFGPWVWAVMLLVCVTCAGLVAFQARQGERNERAYEAVRLLRNTRLDLTKGFLHLSESGRPGSPFSRAQGLALIDQATDRLERDLAASAPDASRALIVAARRLREFLVAWPESGLADAGYAAELRARFLAVEREADVSDRVLRERVHAASEARRREFATVALGAAGLVILASCALLLLRRRGARAARSARESAERFAAVVENLGEGLVLIDASGGRASWNPAALALHGWDGDGRAERSPEEFAGAFEVRTVNGGAVNPADWPLARVARGETLHDLELCVRRRADGRERIFSYGGAPIRDGRGPSFGFVTIRDVTARREAERGLRELNAELEGRVAARTAELEAKNRELETFTYSVSHDLKAPLRGIDGYGSLLLDEHAGRLNEEGREFVANIRQATVRMGQLIDDLLAYSRLERRASNPGRVVLLDVARDQLRSHASDLAASGARVTELVPAELVVRADAQAFEMALRNLIDNALKFTRPGTAPEIEIGARRDEGGLVVLWVRDAGIGFDMRYGERIFEIFQRLHRTEDYPGTGVGLAIVRKAMERMGGRVEAESEPGKGSTFYLILPEADAP